MEGGIREAKSCLSPSFQTIRSSMCLWLSLQGTGPITCTGETGSGPYSALNRGAQEVGGALARFLVQGTLKEGKKAADARPDLYG